METIFTDLKKKFRNGTILTQLIFINAGVFIIIRLMDVFMTLFSKGGYFSFLPYLQMPSDPLLLLQKPWTIITYMFTHVDFLHILFNMLWLYWFGKIFLQFFSSRQLGGLYILGGIGGALLYLLSFNLLPYFRMWEVSVNLIGASAAIMAIVFGVAFYNKNLEIHLLFLGRLKLIYLAWFTLLLDLLLLTSENAGGHIAHIGGALIGIWFAKRMQVGKDLTAPMNRLIDKVVNLFKRKPKMKVTYKRNETDYEYNARKNKDNAQLDAILDKLKRSGYDSLTAEEKKSLFDASNK